MTAVEFTFSFKKHDGKHENWHDTLYPHGDKHYNKHDKDGLYGFQIIETKRAFEYDDDGKLLSATENEDRQDRYDYTFRYDDMGNRTFYAKSKNGKVQESAEYTYNSAKQPIKVKQYDGKHYKNVEYSYDADGNRILEEEVKPDGTRKVEKSYEYTVENRLKAVSDKNDLLAAMAYDGDGNRIFQLNYNLHTDDDWKGNSGNGNGNGNNKDNPGSGNNGNNSGNGTGSKAKAASEDAASIAAAEATEPGLWDKVVTFFTGNDEEKTGTEAATGPNTRSSNKDKDKGNNGNDKNNGVGNGNTGNNGNTNKPNKPNDNTGGSQNQSGILFPIDGEVSELEGELIDMIKTTGKHKNYELVEYVNDVNRDYAEVLMELNINGIMDTAYSYGDQRLTNERFTEWTGYYTYDARGSVSGATDDEGMIWQSYCYSVSGEITFGKPQYNNVYSFNAESYSPNMDTQYLRARYYSVGTANFLTEDSYLGDITDPLTLNRYNYTKSSYLNYIDPSGYSIKSTLGEWGVSIGKKGLGAAADIISQIDEWTGYEYNFTPEPETGIFSSDDYYFQDWVVQSGVHLTGLTGSKIHEYEKGKPYTLGEKMNNAFESMALDFCDEESLQAIAHSSIGNKLANAAGFIWDPETNIYFTRKDSLQRQFGFNDGIDRLEFSLGMNLNSLPIIFKDATGQKEWRIELWSDDYYSGNDAKDWWLTQFKLGEHSDKEDLSMKAEIDFGNQKDLLKDKFLEQTKKLQEEGVPIITTHSGSKVTISWKPNK